MCIFSCLLITSSDPLTAFFKRQVTVVLVLTCALGLVGEISQGFQWTGQAGKQILMVSLYFSVPAGIFSAGQPVDIFSIPSQAVALISLEDAV